MMSSEQLHRDVVEFCISQRLLGLSWLEIEALVWRTYLNYGLSFACEFHDWINEAKAKRIGMRA